MTRAATGSTLGQWRARVAFFLAALLLVGTHLYFGRGPIERFSPTFDEPAHITAGFIYLTEGNQPGQYRFNCLEHPPFGVMWAAFPLVLMGAELPRDTNWTDVGIYPFSDEFIYRNTFSADTILSAARSMQLLLSILFGLFLGLYVRRFHGPVAALCSMGFWALSPTFLAHGTLATTDLAYAVFFFAFFCLLGHTAGGKSKWAAGLALGLCLVSKYFSLAILPSLAGIWLWEKRKRIFQKNFCTADRGNVRAGITVALIALGVVLLAFRGYEVDIFYKGMRNIVFRAAAGEHQSFFLGDYRAGGWLLYFPVAFVLKTPLPLLFSLILATALAWRKNLRIRSRLLIPPLVVFVLSCLSAKQIGHRYIMAVYPFLFLIGGIALSKLHRRTLAIVAVPVFAGLLIGAVMTQPHFLSYFNVLAGGSSQGYRYFTDSNVDWGHGLKELRAALSSDDLANGVYLCYFGVGDPEAYGIPYRLITRTAIPRTSALLPAQATPTKLVVSVTHLQAFRYGDNPRLQWLEDFQASELVANSLLVYDLAGSPEALRKCEQLAQRIE